MRRTSGIRQQRVRIRQPGIGQRVRRVERDGLLEMFDGFLQILRGALVPVETPSEVKLIGFDVFRMASSQMLCSSPPNRNSKAADTLFAIASSTAKMSVNFSSKIPVQ